MLHNEKGMTLLEVVTATALLLVVVTVSISMYWSVQSYFHNTSSEFITESEMQSTIHYINEEISQAATVVHVNNELRFRQGNKYRSLHYNEGTLSLYDYNNNGAPDQLVYEFTNSFNSPSTTPSLYSNKKILTTKLAQAPVYMNETTSQPINHVPVSDGAKMNVTLQFQYEKMNATGTKKKIDDATRFQHTVTTKLIVDYLD